MRYFRVLAMVTLMASVALAAVALGHSSRPAPAGRLHQALQQAAQQFLAVPRPAAPPRGSNAAPPPRGMVLPPRFWNISPPQLQGVAPVPQGGGSCDIATNCSIKGCVIPVANGVGPVVPSLGSGATGCPLGDRVPRAYRVSTR